MTLTKERIIEELKASTQNASGMFEINEDTICALMELLESSADAEPVAWQHRLVELSTGQATPWKLTSRKTESTQGERYRVDVIPLYTRPHPAPVVVQASVVESLATNLMKRIDKITGERHSIATLSSLRVSIVDACRAAMLQGKAETDGNGDELPLDYLQGYKDGLEWSALMAEANHPQTGDWLFDDPLELAKAIRKGPDMLPAAPQQETK